MRTWQRGCIMCQFGWVDNDVPVGLENCCSGDGGDGLVTKSCLTL